MNSFIDNNLQEQNGTWVTNRTCQKHQASNFKQQFVQEALLKSMNELHITKSNEDDLEDTQEAEKINTKNFDGESDEDITYNLGQDSPFERK